MKTTDNDNSPILPLENIALAFSGGGFRAAAFSLGTLSYLNHLKINGEPAINHVHYSSSTSGGTITNLLFTSSLRKKDNFFNFYRHLINRLNGEDLLEKALTILNEKGNWSNNSTGKERNLINAFAKVYDQELFGKKTDGSFIDDPEDATMAIFWKNMEANDYEVCFNTTEFYRGQSFRFRTTGKDKEMGKIGNKYVYFNERHFAALKKIKLGDVLAASSCFPAGFEPIVFPRDFTYANLSAKELSDALYYTNYKLQTQPLSDPIWETTDYDPKQKSYIKHLCFMDGGITDNQGVKSMMDADIYRRNNKQKAFDLMLVTDVTSYFIDNFETSPVDTQTAWLNHNAERYVKRYQPWLVLIKSIQFFFLLAGGSLLGLSIFLSLPLPYKLVFCGFGSCLFLIGLLITYLRVSQGLGLLMKGLAVFNFNKWFMSIVPLKKSFNAEILSKLVNYLKETPLNILEHMFKDRLRSVMTMVQDVNLKQVRRLIFNIFWEDDRWRDRRQSNFIYDLSSHNTESREYRLKGVYNDYLKNLESLPNLSNTNLVKSIRESSLEYDLLTENVNQLAYIAERARKVGTTLWFEDQGGTSSALSDIVKTGQFTTCVNLLEYCLGLRTRNVQLLPGGDIRLSDLITQLTADFKHFKEDPSFLWNSLENQ